MGCGDYPRVSAPILTGAFVNVFVLKKRKSADCTKPTLGWEMGKDVTDIL